MFKTLLTKINGVAKDLTTVLSLHVLRQKSMVSVIIILAMVVLLDKPMPTLLPIPIPIIGGTV